MTFRVFTCRLAYVILFTWIVGSIFDSFGWALYFALLPFTFYELFRFRRSHDDDQEELHQDL